MRINPYNIRNGLKSLYFYIFRLALGGSFFRGNDDFTQFIILSAPRSGTNFLRSALNRHSQIFVFGELFRFPNKIGWDFWAFNNLPLMNSKDMISLVNLSPDKFIKNHVFAPPPYPFTSIGFKIFYFHNRNQQGIKVWEYLKKDKNIKVIHLRRNNMLKTFLSHRRALQTEKWIDILGRKLSPQAIFLDPHDCRNYFQRMTKWEDENDNRFSHHHKLDICYENMISNREYELSRIQSFLNVDTKHIIPSTVKQTKREISDDIKNYEELERFFRGTEWSRFFF
jgi:LPS sulfotransferase NodH